MHQEQDNNPFSKVSATTVSDNLITTDDEEEDVRIHLKKRRK